MKYKILPLLNWKTGNLYFFSSQDCLWVSGRESKSLCSFCSTAFHIFHLMNLSWMAPCRTVVVARGGICWVKTHSGIITQEKTIGGTEFGRRLHFTNEKKCILLHYAFVFRHAQTTLCSRGKTQSTVNKTMVSNHLRLTFLYLTPSSTQPSI